jgi:hypothetical protein
MRKTISAVILTAAVAVSAVALAKLPALRADESKVYVENSYAVPSGEVAINATNFPDANFRTYVSRFDTDKSGGLSTSEIESVDEIDCSEKNISDLKGIEYFTALLDLDCSYNQLTSLDVRSNTQLIYLCCNYNQLTTLVVSKNTALEYLVCDNNQLTTLDTSKNTELEELQCDNNQLTSLDVSKNMVLRELICDDNQLTTLNVSKNTALEWLECGCNELAYLDVSKNTELYGLYCWRNQLTSLDVARNKNLYYLACQGNQIKKLDIHLCPNLVDLTTTKARRERKTDSYVFYCYGSSYDGNYLAYDKSVTLITKGPSVGKVTGLKALSAGRNKVKLTWNAVDGAEGYLVYAQKDKKYGYVGMTTQGTTFTDTKALDTDYNYYWVFAYVKDVDGSMVAGGCEKYVYAKGVCLAVTDLKASSGAGYVKLSWTASAGADGYLIYGIRPGAAYGYIGMTAQGTTFTDTKASKADYTFYWVFPYHKDANGNMIVGGTAKYTYGKAR